MQFDVLVEFFGSLDRKKDDSRKGAKHAKFG